MRTTSPVQRFPGEPRPPRDTPRILNLDETARFCGVPRRSVVDWIDRGLLRVTKLSDGTCRITADDFSAFLGNSDILTSAAADGVN